MAQVDAASRPGLPPLVLIPPVGVGIDRRFFSRLQDCWQGGAATHAPDLLGIGSATPKPRRFYAPEVWAGQLDDYIRSLGEPCVLVSQGGQLPCALETWRLGGAETIKGLALLSPPPLSFVTDDEGAAPDRTAPPRRRAKRRAARVAWALSASPVGNASRRARKSSVWSCSRRGYDADRPRGKPLHAVATNDAVRRFFRRLRGANGARIKSFTERSLFAGEVDDRWVRQCVDSARDARGRFATLSYLCGTIPAGGVWRDDRGPLLADLDVPTTVVRGDFPGARDPVARTRDALAGLPAPAGGYVVDGARACLPWEQPERCAAAVGDFVARQFGGAAVTLPEGVAVVEAEAG